MPAYHQMGHHSENLVFDENLAAFRGVILSPVNSEESKSAEFISRLREHDASADIVFDPQLYFPSSNRGALSGWSHYPSDVDTADLSSEKWWESRVASVAEVAKRLSADSICSPVVVPRVFSGTSHYTQMVQVGNSLATRLPNTSVLQTVLVDLDDVSVSGRADEIASIASQSKADRVFLVIHSDIQPRREIADTESAKGVMRLIHLLEGGDQRVLVGFSSSDVALWKAAGAHSCATGKFFNLRRFTPSRFDEPSGGGGQLAYMFEEEIFSYLRESDIIRVEQEVGLSDASARNPVMGSIREAIAAGQAWVSLGWRQYLWWFADFESRATRESVKAGLKSADNQWKRLDEADVFTEERHNDGAWIRQWRRAVSEFSK